MARKALVGKVIANDGKAIGVLLAAHYNLKTYSHLGNFAFLAETADGTMITVFTSPIDSDGKYIRIDAIHDPATTHNSDEKGEQT